MTILETFMPFRNFGVHDKGARALTASTVCGVIDRHIAANPTLDFGVLIEYTNPDRSYEYEYRILTDSFKEGYWNLWSVLGYVAPNSIEFGESDGALAAKYRTSKERTAEARIVLAAHDSWMSCSIDEQLGHWEIEEGLRQLFSEADQRQDMRAYFTEIREAIKAMEDVTDPELRAERMAMRCEYACVNLAEDVAAATTSAASQAKNKEASHA